MVDMAGLKALNAERWRTAQLTRNYVSIAKSLVSPAAKKRYQTVERYTGVPWHVVAVIHERESSQDWGANLAQGDPWNRVSIHVPKGRGPFESWETAAIDALVNCSPYAARNHDWSEGGTLTLLEEYNGLGYASMGRPSPYIWSGTDIYHSGKYVADGRYNASVIDVQPGCASLLKHMMTLDSEVVIGKTRPTGPVVVQPKPVPVPVQPRSWLTIILDFIKALFGGR